MDELGSIHPFRWDITSRSRLGTLIGTPDADRDEWLDWKALTAHFYRWNSKYPYSWFLNELTLCAARVLSSCDNSDLCFVGRSPESLFDFLSGLLFDTSWNEKLTLVHFSMGGMTEQRIKDEHAGALESIRKYLTILELDPKALARRARPVASVDIVASGRTFGGLITIIHDWCNEIRFDWPAVQRKIRIIGLTERTHSSPKTWRWQQHVEWVEKLPALRIKNISLPVALFNFLGEGQPKTTKSYVPRQWGDPQVASPLHDDERLRALRIAAALFDDGRDKAQRLKFAAELRKQPAMKQSWFRSLVGEVKS